VLIALEIAICLASIYALGALVCSAIQESLAQFFELRSKNLKTALGNLLQNEDLGKVLSHPLVRDMWDGNQKPTVLPSPIFARALIHAFEAPGAIPSQDASALLATIPISVKRQLVPFLDADAKTATELYAAAQRWFDTSMAAASDRYSRMATAWGLAVAIGFAVALNIDTVGVASKLAQQPSRRMALVTVAQQVDDQYKRDPASVCQPSGSGSKVTDCLDALTDASGDLIGWNRQAVATVASPALLMMIAGWMTSGFAMSLGAKFWFDALARLLSIRSGLSDKDLKAAEKSTSTASS
jgi:hypothetical protein